jgi:hypothetical protein
LLIKSYLSLSQNIISKNLTLLHKTPGRMHAYLLLRACHIFRWMHAVSFAPRCYSRNKTALNPGTNGILGTPAAIPPALPSLPPGAQHLPAVDGQHPPTADPAAHAWPLTPIGSRVFNRAQAAARYPSAPYAWGAPHTGSSNATPLPHGTACTKPSQNGSAASCSSVRTTNPFAPIGNTNEDASANGTTNDTFALDAVRPATELRHVLERRKLRALTPYKPDVWESLLARSGLLLDYPHLPDDLRFGFNIKLPRILYTQAPPNRPAIREFRHQFTKIVRDEFEKGRYIGPFTQTDIESLIGPFQSSPLSIIPKPAKPDKFRITQNYSFPHKTSPAFPNPSINSFIDSDDFPTTWGTFSVTALLLRRLPPGSQIATRDVSEAYRTIPLHPSQWPAAVARLDEDSFAIDTSICFGISPSAGTYGQVWQAGSDILRSHGIGPLSGWVDDHLFLRIPRRHLNEYNVNCSQWSQDISCRGIHQQGGRVWYGGHLFEDGTLEEFDEDCRFPCRDLSGQSSRSSEDQLFTYNFDDIDRISDQLGIPWDRSKDQHFNHSTTYIGFVWDLSTLRVSLGPAKKEKYSRAIIKWKGRSAHVLNDVEKLHGKLLHACLVVPSGRAYLTGLEAMLSTSHHSPHVPQSANKGIASDLDWWSSLLRRSTLSKPIPAPVQLFDIGAFSDASSGIGIGIVVGDKWRAWRLIPGWQTLRGSRDIGWAEAIGFECLVRHLFNSSTIGRNFTVYGDNKGVVEGWWNGRSRNRAVNEVFKRIHSFIGIDDPLHSFHSVYVASQYNPADGPSRGIYPPTSQLLPPINLPAELAPFLIDAQLPPTPTEQRLLREGRYPPAAAKGIVDANRRAEASLQFSLDAIPRHLQHSVPR